MRIELNRTESRIIGCLIEKEITTPELYPLSLNALTNACNQKSNRDPVLDLGESEVRQVVDGLIARYPGERGKRLRRTGGQVPPPLL